METPVSRSRSALSIHWLHPDATTPPTLLDGSVRSIGRGDECDAVLHGNEISRVHAELRREGRLAVIRDAGSRNRLFVNGEPVAEAPLGRGDVVRAGEWVGVVSERAHAGTEEMATGLLAGPALRECLEGLEAIAKSALPIVLEGGPGTGKERVAAAVHEWSGRSGRLVAINCAAIPETLGVDQLFGHRKGAFTGAEQQTLGLFRAADGGTLFLDEILDLSPLLQATLLRAIEQREILPLGATDPIRVDIRVVVATPEPMADAVAAGRFRGDLLSRLDGRTVRLPPLCERREEIPSLFRAMLARRTPHPPLLHAGLVEALCLLDWPSNVRALDLLAERMLAEHREVTELHRSHLPRELLQSAPRRPRPSRGASAKQAQLERLIAALREHRGNVTRAAAAAGLSRQQAYRAIEDAGIDVAVFRASSP